MIERVVLLLTILLCFLVGSAQIEIRTVSSLRFGTSLPATCNASTGQVFFLTSGTTGIYACTTTDTWTISGAIDSTTAGITASVTQTQGQGALTTAINQISTVANANDTVTLPDALAGLVIEVINDGANSLQVFPASGDDLGLGVNLATTIEAPGRVKFVSYDATNWDVESGAAASHGEMHDLDNSDAFGVSAANNVEVYHTNGIHIGDSLGWTFDIGGGGTSFAISAVGDAGGGDITVTTSLAHGLAVGAIISQANLTNAVYEGVFVVNTVPTTTTYTVTAAFTATDTGTMQEASTLTASALAAGDYMLVWSASATTASNNETFDFDIYVNATEDEATTSRNRFGIAADVQQVGGVGILEIASGDRILFAITNLDSAGDLTISNLVIALHMM